MYKTKTLTLSGWGRFPVHRSEAIVPWEMENVHNILIAKKLNWIAYGLGRSYGDTSLNKDGGTVVTARWNKLLSFDEKSGILECEAGVAFKDILEVFLPRGYFLPVTPGTKFVTVGGAIANDVHGKNHHVDGTFSEHVLEFTLLLASGEVIRCSRTENAPIFWATVGGIGLTGIILTAKIRLIPVPSSYIDVHYQKARNLEEALRLFQESDSRYRYSVAWIDCLAKGKSLGRCVLMRGNHASPEQVKAKNKFSVRHHIKLTVPFDFPSFVLNRFSISAFNALYYGSKPRDARRITGYDPFFYPLDSIHHWNRMYGKRGFIQYQIVLPPERSLEGLAAVLENLREKHIPAFLAVLKSFGDENAGLLSFPKKGFTLALDIPIHDDSLFPFIRSMNELVLRYGGRVYLAKDAVLEPDHFKAMYPRAKEFMEIKRKVDPNQLFSSSMARRLGIVEG